MIDRLNGKIYIGGLIEKTQEHLSECYLWRAVISQAVSDAYLDDYRHKQSVAEWIDTEDFETVCDFAGVATPQMRDNIRTILQSKPAIARYKGRKLKDLIDKKH
jgi:hypothetical protein